VETLEIFRRKGGIFGEKVGFFGEKVGFFGALWRFLRHFGVFWCTLVNFGLGLWYFYVGAVILHSGKITQKLQ